MDYIMKLVNGLAKVTKGISKNAPLLLTVTGMVGMGATVVFAYKSRTKVDAILTDIEGRREDAERMEQLEQIIDYGHELSEDERTEYLYLQENAQPVDKVETIKDLAAATALPVLTGVASLAAVTLSWYIMNNRLLTVSGALATATAEHAFYRRRVRDQYGAEAERAMNLPVHQSREVVKDEDGNEEAKEVTVKDGLGEDRRMNGAWFTESFEYAADDHSYNKQFVEAQKEKLENQFTRNGSLLLNQVYDALGFPRTKMGAVMGWSGAGFALEPETVHAYDKESGFVEPELYIHWSAPRYIYDTIELETPIAGLI